MKACVGLAGVALLLLSAGCAVGVESPDDQGSAREVRSGQLPVDEQAQTNPIYQEYQAAPMRVFAPHDDVRDQPINDQRLNPPVNTPKPPDPGPGPGF